MGRDAAPLWALDHPHFSTTPRKRNVLYRASADLWLGGRLTGLPGAGVFRKYDDALRLTAPGCKRSVWRLPGWFHPGGHGRTLGYHGDTRRWSRDGEHAVLRSVARGQEFVFDAAVAECVPAAAAWVRRLVKGQGPR